MPDSPRPTPTPAQLAWQDLEAGALVCLDVLTYAPQWQHADVDNCPSPTLFNPRKLDTDQWLEAIKGMGARYAVLVARHCAGFCLWPTETCDYGVRQSPWRDGRGDIVADFVASCRKYDILPGLYCHIAVNSHCRVSAPGRVQSGDPAEQARYKAASEQALKELWGNYGELAEVWFDGGTLPPDEGGPDFAPLLRDLQPNAIVFQSAQASIRWVGNEDGVAPYPCWSTVNTPGEPGVGDPAGACWCPAEVDTPTRELEWFWQPEQEHKTKSVEHLVDCYYQSVGRNGNLLIGVAPDRDGLVPDYEARLYAELGDEIRRRFGRPLAQTEGEGKYVELRLDGPARIDHVEAMEDLRGGERVREYIIEAKEGPRWRPVASGSAIGHKRIERITPVVASGVRLRCRQSVAEPRIRSLAVYDAHAADD